MKIIDNAIKRILTMPSIINGRLAKYFAEMWKAGNLERYEALLDDIINPILNTYPDCSKPLATAVFNNQKKSMLESYSFKEKISKDQDEFVLHSTTHIVNTYCFLRNFIGVQPMQGPVSTAHLLRFSVPTLNMVNDPVEAKSRRLWPKLIVSKQKFTDADVVNTIGEEFSTDILQSVISELYTCASAKHTFDFNNYTTDVVKRLIVEINSSANNISAKTRRGPANFIIVSPMVLTLFQAVPSVNFMGQENDKKDGVLGLSFAGTLDSGAIKVYCHSYAKNDDILIGYKGPMETDTGYCLNPYVPLVSLGPVIDPSTFEPVVSFLTRFGESKATPITNVTVGVTYGDYYEILEVANIDFLKALT